LFSVVVAFFGLGMAIASIQFGAAHFPARASATDDLVGWVWSDPSGWISVNSDNPGACSPGPCGSYGMNLDTGTKVINGFAWSDVAGWICFGSSCAASAACNGTPPAGPLTAYISPGAGTVPVHGWAKVCNEGDDGWISLNCAEPGVCAAVAPYYHAVFNQSTGVFSDATVPGTSFGWNGASGGLGFGYMDFQLVRLRGEAPPFCADGIDNDTNGLRDCQEATCSGDPACQEAPANGNCNDGIDNNFNGPIDCQEAACNIDPSCAETISNGNKCANGIDDNGNGLVDCADSGCVGYPACLVSGESACGPLDNLGRPGTPDNCCTDGADNDSDTKTDCEQDASCQNQAPICTPAWLQAKFGNVYAQQGITGQQTYGGQNLSTGTYCLTSQGAITGFSSQSGCSESSSQSLTLPNVSTGYTGTLGSIDVNGILGGRYGKVVNYTGVLPAVLDGKVYHAIGNSTLNATTFQNGSGATQRGNGLLIIEGTLTVNGNLGYQTNTLTQYLKNLASLGIIVKKIPVGQPGAGTGGIINISPTVTDLIGAYFAEDTINTGTTGSTDQPLKLFGLMAAYRLNLQRNFHSAVQAAEVVAFDGRAVANPPPGMSEVSKSLPTSKEGF
jgi:hypothetical protein